MGSLSIESSYKSLNLALSPQQIRDKYFFGIDIKDQSGRFMPDEDIESWIRSSQRSIENELSLLLDKQMFEETKHFSRNDYNNFSYVRMSYPIRCIYKVEGYVGNTRQTKFPDEWISITSSDDDRNLSRNFRIVPNGGSASDHATLYAGLIPNLGYMGMTQIPNYWKIKYVTGFDNIPDDIVNAVGIMTAINIFHIMGDLIIGAGIASQSVGIDGLSQSISTTSSATNAGYGARIEGYVKQLKQMMPVLRDIYLGFNFGSL